MRPSPDLLTEVLPSDHLGPTGRPVGELRDELYRIPDLANAGHVAGVWIQSVGVLALAAWWGNPIGWLIAFLLMGRALGRFAILAHEAAHRLLFSNRNINDWVGAWLVAYPAFVPLDAYRRSHMAHHKEEFGPNEPDMGLYSGYPITADSWRRKLTRDADGNSGWKNLKGLLGASAVGHGATRGPQDPGLAGRALRRAVGRAGQLVDLPALLAAALDDGLAGASTDCGPSPSTAACSGRPTVA